MPDVAGGTQGEGHLKQKTTPFAAAVCYLSAVLLLCLGSLSVQRHIDTRSRMHPYMGPSLTQCQPRTILCLWAMQSSTLGLDQQLAL